MRAAIGTKVIVVVPVATQIKRNIVKNASAGIVNTLTKKTSALKRKSRANAETPTLVRTRARLAILIFMACSSFIA